MEQYIITIDGGTTNTRCILWDNRRNRVGEERREVGVRNTAIDGNNERLKQAVKECLECLTRDNGVGWDRIHRIIASGMITSDVGMVVVPHLTAPAGLAELAEATVAIQMPEICPIPIYFIPGIKNFSQDVTFDNFEAMDIMRGEEVESIPIIEKYHNGSPMILVLPGSHNKFVAVDGNRKMTGCLTSISGELLASITNDTIIAKSVGKRFLDAADYDREWLLLGYRNAKKTGLGRACFSARILYLFKDSRVEKIQNYILGAALAGDITAIMNSSAVRADRQTVAVVCGKNPLKQALIDIMECEDMFSRVFSYEPEEGMSTSALGAYMIAEKSKII